MYAINSKLLAWTYGILNGLHNFSAPSFKVKLFHLLSHKSEVCIHLAEDHRNLESTEFGTGKSGVVSYLVNI